MLNCPLVVSVISGGALVSSAVFFDPEKAKAYFCAAVYNRLVSSMDADDEAADRAKAITDSGECFEDGDYRLVMQCSENLVRVGDVLSGDDCSFLASHIADSIELGDDGEGGAAFSVEDLNCYLMRQFIDKAIQDMPSS